MINGATLKILSLQYDRVELEKNLMTSRRPNINTWHLILQRNAAANPSWSGSQVGPCHNPGSITGTGGRSAFPGISLSWMR